MKRLFLLLLLVLTSGLAQGAFTYACNYNNPTGNSIYAQRRLAVTVTGTRPATLWYRHNGAAWNACSPAATFTMLSPMYQYFHWTGLTSTSGPAVATPTAVSSVYDFKWGNDGVPFTVVLDFPNEPASITWVSPLTVGFTPWQYPNQIVTITPQGLDTGSAVVSMVSTDDAEHSYEVRKNGQVIGSGSFSGPGGFVNVETFDGFAQGDAFTVYDTTSGTPVLVAGGTFNTLELGVLLDVYVTANFADVPLPPDPIPGDIDLENLEQPLVDEIDLPADPADPPLTNPETVTPPPLVIPNDTPQEQVAQLDTATRASNAEIAAYLKSIEKNIREQRDEKNQNETDAKALGDGSLEAIEGLAELPSAAAIWDHIDPRVRDAVLDGVRKPTATLPMPADYNYSGSSSWMVNISLYGPAKLVDLNPLTNPDTGPYVRAMGDWCKAIIMALVIIMGTSRLYDLYYESFRDLVAPRGSFRLGIGATVGIGDVVTCITGTVAALAAGAVSYGTASVAIIKTIAAAMMKFVVPTLVHLGFFVIALIPAYASIGAQGLIGNLPFSTTDISSAPGSGMGSSLWGLIASIPSFAQNGLAIVAAFVPLIFLTAYVVSYFITSRLIKMTTAFAMASQALLGKS